MPSEYYTTSYYEELSDSSARSAQIIVPFVLELVQARSVVDVGCGVGAWLAAFQRFGVDDVLGVDGDYVDRNLLQIPKDRFQAADLSTPLSLPRAFDLAISMEVAEHLPADCASQFVASLIRLASVVLFSAAIPFQGGTQHLNEQWPDNWAELFKVHGYVPVDAIRKRVWHNEAVAWWYAQNTLLFIREDVLESNLSMKAEFEQTNLNQLRLVHPGNYLQALQPIEPPDWRVGTASQLLRACVRNGIKRRLYALAGRKSVEDTLRNPPNFNLALQDATCYGITKRPGPDRS